MKKQISNISNSFRKNILRFGFASFLAVSFLPALQAQEKLKGVPPTVAINYIGGGLNKPSAIALDQSGNVWVANYDKNNLEVAALIQRWLEGKGLTKKP